MGLREVVKWSFQAKITRTLSSLKIVSLLCVILVRISYILIKGIICFVGAKRLVLGKWAFTEMVNNGIKEQIFCSV